ncbi:hypothetical protein GA0004736_0307 [Curtobacterium sp. 9128]|uniref:hypothetical protein n=1 Tax=Curtobacterium sp. 9128 TaxID=1793722 RepID=UPI0007D73003|nr:hypothetical protein [Curtobacterium sp. 9128]SBN61420.1 hypothetical protein GA0004736_0307 [Curtobacterium sp. 9128]
MADALAERCTMLGGPVIGLMQAVMGSQVNAIRFVEVIERAREIQRIVARGTEGIDDPAYTRWVATAPVVLDEIIDGAEHRDRDRVWAAFSDPERGMNALAAACTGQPGW